MVKELIRVSDGRVICLNFRERKTKLIKILCLYEIQQRRVQPWHRSIYQFEELIDQKRQWRCSKKEIIFANPQLKCIQKHLDRSVNCTELSEGMKQQA